LQRSTVPTHLNLSGQSISLIAVPSIDETNWWWTCCNSYNPRNTDSHYSAIDIGRPHKVGACPEVTEADRLLMNRDRSKSVPCWSPEPSSAPVPRTPKPRARTPAALPPLKPDSRVSAILFPESAEQAVKSEKQRTRNIAL